MVLMRFLIALLALGGLLDSFLALRIHQQDPLSAPPCAVTERWDCGRVNHSRYAVFPPEALFPDPSDKSVHVPVAWFGIAGYALIAVPALAKRFWLTLAAAFVGFGFAAYLSYLEWRVIDKWCIYCVWSQALIAAIVVCTAVALWLERRRGSQMHAAVVAA